MRLRNGANIATIARIIFLEYSLHISSKSSAAVIAFYLGSCRLAGEEEIGIIHDKDIWYYVGEKDFEGKRLKNDERFSSFLVDAKRYDDEDILREELESLPKTFAYKILSSTLPKVKKEFTEHPALSREDNETGICLEYGVKEAVEAYSCRNR